MDIKEKVMSILQPICKDVSFLSREADNVFPFLVFNVTETPMDYADDTDNATLFLVAINIFSKPDYNFEAMKLNIIEQMVKAGFKKQIIPPAQFMEKEDVYNQPLAFSIYKDNQEVF